MVAVMNDTIHAFRIDRAGRFDADYSTQIAQSISAALSTVAPGTTFIARATDEGSIERYFVSTGSNAADRSFQIAKAFMSEVSKTEAPELATTNVARLEFDKRESFVATATQAGTTLSAVASAIDAYLTAGEWVAVSVRKASAKERKRWNIWHEHHRAGAVTTHSRRSDAVIFSVYAGSHDPGRASNAVEQFVNSLGGFEINGRPTMLDPRRERKPWFLFSNLAVLAVLLCSVLRFFAEEITDFLGESLANQIMPYVPTVQWVCIGLVIAITMGLLAHKYGYFPSAVRTAKKLLSTGLAPSPPKRHSAPKKPKRESTEVKTVDGQSVAVHKPAEDGDYPLDPATFMVGSELAASILLPGQGAKSGVASTRSRDVPSAVTNTYGPVIGVVGDLVARLSAADFWGGIFVIGKAGSGKSRLLEWLWAWKQAHLRPLAGTPNAMSGAMVAFDTKGDSSLTNALVQWSGVTGVRTHVVKLSDAAPLGLNIFDTSGTKKQQAERVLDALSYLVGEAAGPRFRETAGVVLPLAMLVDERVTNGADWLPQQASKFAYAHILTGAMGFERAKELYLLIRERHGATPEVDAGVNLFGDRVTDSQFKNLVESTRNKLDSLAYTESFWRAGEAENTAGWGWLLTQGKSVVFDFAGLSERAVADIAQLLLFTLKAAAEKHCTGFQEQGRSVTPLADEASVIAEHSPDIVEWMRSKARAFGFEPMFATQQPSQLRNDVRRSLLGYVTKIIFGQSDSGTLRELAVELSTGGDTWSEDDIKNLPRYAAIIATEVDATAQPNFMVDIPDLTGSDPKAE